MAGFEGHEGEALTGAQKILALVINGLSTEQFASLKERAPTREKKE